MSCCAGASAAAPEVTPVFRHVRADFGPLLTKPLHLDLTFDIQEDRIRVTSTTTFLHTPETPLTKLQLNSKDLTIESVELVSGGSVLNAAKPSPADFVAHVASFAQTKSTSLKYEVDTKDHFLKIDLSGEPIKAGQQFTIRTVSVAKPTAHILEGFYYDYTPAGQPKTIITQCQQYGFQRMVPALDFMTAKAYYTTRIIADKRYSHMISNGDLAPGFFDPMTGDTKPHPVAGDDKRVMVEYHNHLVNMASYLFFLGVGTYQSYKGEFEYCNGSTHLAELLVFPNLVDPRHARTALKSLIDSIYWCYLSTGPEATDHHQEREKIYKLIAMRDELKAQKGSGNAEMWGPEQEKALTQVREELKKLISVWGKTGYQYTGQIYREISMQNSDYGGMENVGNTTILASRMVPSDLLVDPGYLYMEGVKIHEYYHNINGSQVTGDSPFEIWLNEAVTVYIQRQRENVLFGADFMRLKEVLYSFTPGQGPLAIDGSANAMPIEPRGFNRTQELISAATYSKAPEFCSMLQKIVGEATFNRGLDYYHTKYSFSNATTDDWIRAMEHASGKKLMDMANQWLRRAGHPHVTYSSKYDAASKTYTVDIEQTGMPKSDPTPWIFPIDYALVKGGKCVKEGIFVMEKAKDQLVISGVDTAPDFLSFARGWSFFGTHKNASASREELTLQALTDPDVINRYFAYRAIVDTEKAQIIEKLVKGDKSHEVSKEFIKLHTTILFDSKVNAGARAMILREGDDIHSRPDLSFLYQEISDARVALMQAVWDNHGQQVYEAYVNLEKANRAGPHIDQLHDRTLKHHLFGILAAGVARASVLTSRTPATPKADVSALARELLSSPFMSDKIFAFAQYLQSTQATLQEKQQILAEVKNSFSAHPDSIESYIGVITGLDSADAPALIRSLLDDPLFDINLAGHSRTAVRMWAGLRKRSLLTDDGLALTQEMFLRIGKVNQYSAQSFIAALNDLDKFGVDQKKRLVKALREIHAKLDPVKEESLYNQLTALLKPYEAL